MTSHVHGSSCLINQALNHTSSKEALTSGRCGFSITCTRKRLQLRSIGRVAHHRKTIAVRSVLTGDLEENEREKQTSPKVASGWEKWVVKVERGVNVLLTDSVIFLLDNLYADRHYARFYVLETIARVPYFAFVSVLHMYESFGWWRRADYLKVHFAESWNELHHLLVMEALGGDKRWFDRFLAQHIAVAYFFLAALMYTISPRMAYHFSECVERHAYSTYDKFIKQHGAELKKLPAPAVAVEYYTKGDLYMFDEFQTNQVPNSRRPKVDNLYDVFINIRDDEGEHCKTMLACQTPGRLTSPHAITENNGNDVENRALHPAECMGILDCIITSSSSASRAQKQNSLKESGKK
ncbi:hypothetical protein KP509_31G061500 [Ceratopteris richardii]|uniref:Ubiquinol oxidase n=1 Tax=Ceratopteris richardii TaxID=49495 RepID=A0A8T2QYK4_CERRI|nr:hypothetical protein KP509_31G061500 [Ceratopteris richardii]